MSLSEELTNLIEQAETRLASARDLQRKLERVEDAIEELRLALADLGVTG